jgi:hypothetical protein|nr:MAG TPA: hypothetical protein [Caudoviricetes sp.]
MWYSKIRGLKYEGMKKEEGTNKEYLLFKYINSLDDELKHNIIKKRLFECCGMLTYNNKIRLMIDDYVLMKDDYIRIYFHRSPDRISKVFNLNFLISENFGKVKVLISCRHGSISVNVIDLNTFVCKDLYRLLDSDKIKNVYVNDVYYEFTNIRILSINNPFDKIVIDMI